MNKQHRASLQKALKVFAEMAPSLQEMLETVREQREKMQDIADQEQAYLDGRSEKWRQSEDGMTRADALESLNTALGELNSLADIELDTRMLLDSLDGAAFDPEG